MTDFWKQYIWKRERILSPKRCVLYFDTNDGKGAGGDAVSWGTALQAGSSWIRFQMVSLEIFIEIILPAVLWPLGSAQAPTEMSTRNISWGVKAAGAKDWQPYNLYVSIVLKSRSLELWEYSELFQVCTGIIWHLNRMENFLKLHESKYKYKYVFSQSEIRQ